MFFKFDDYRDSDNSYSRRRYRVNESIGSAEELSKILVDTLNKLKKFKGTKDVPLKFADSPKNMDCPLKWTAGANSAGWVDLLHIEDYIDD